MLLFLTSITAKVFSTPSLSSTRRPYNQHLVYFPWALDHCEHKGQVKGLILHIIVKGLVTPVYREAIYHPDLSISETPHISLSSPCTHSFAWSPHIQVPKSFEEFFFYLNISWWTHWNKITGQRNIRANKTRHEMEEWYRGSKKRNWDFSQEKGYGHGS